MRLSRSAIASGLAENNTGLTRFAESNHLYWASISEQSD
jgi:hypothetical protein